jgi:hypothetical protein
MIWDSGSHWTHTLEGRRAQLPVHIRSIHLTVIHIRFFIFHAHDLNGIDTVSTHTGTHSFAPLVSTLQEGGTDHIDLIATDLILIASTFSSFSSRSDISREGWSNHGRPGDVPAELTVWIRISKHYQ